MVNEIFILSAFFVVLREVLEATLVSGVILAFLRRTGATQFRPFVFAGLLAGVVVTLFFATTLGLLFSLRGARPFAGRGGRIFEGALFSVAAVLLTWLIVWMSSGRAPVRNMERSLEGLLEREDLFSAKLALFSMVFLTVCREGFETVVFLIGAAESGARVRWRGVILPSVLAVLVGAATGLLIFQGLIALDLSRFLSATGTILLFFSAGLLEHAVQAFRIARVFGAKEKWWNWGMWDKSACCDDTYNEFFSSLRSLFGYEDSPSFIEFVSYFSYWVIVAVLAAIQNRSRLQGMRLTIAIIARTLTLCLFFAMSLSSIYCFRHPTWNGLLFTVGLWALSCACIVTTFDCFVNCFPLVRWARRATVFALSGATMLTTVVVTVMHVLQMGCEERFVRGQSCQLGRFFYLGIVFTDSWLLLKPEYSHWNAIAVLAVSLVLSVLFLLLYAGSLLLFAANLDRTGGYTYRAIVPAKDLTEESAVTEVDITSEEALSRNNSLLHPWLSPPPSPTPTETGRGSPASSSPERVVRTPKRVRFNLEDKYPIQG